LSRVYDREYRIIQPIDRGDAAVSKDAWTAQFYGQNITDTRGKVFISDSQAIETETEIRPRVLGVKFGYRF
jgi:iron complex outermembrane recepter protein